jgi:predicted chitinase
MDATTLQKVMGNVRPKSYYQYWLPHIDYAMVEAGCMEGNKERRSAVLLAEAKVESVGLIYTQEIGSSSYLRSRPYYPYIGRGFIQCTWDYNYKSFGTWAHSRGLIKDPLYFWKSPVKLADPKWAALTLPWYWSFNHGWIHGTINAAADAGDIVDASHMVNGGDNNLQDRINAYHYALSLGSAILPQEVMMLRQVRQALRQSQILNKQVADLDKQVKAHERRLNIQKARQQSQGQRIATLEKKEKAA